MYRILKNTHMHRKCRYYRAAKVLRSSQKIDIHVILLLYAWLFVFICTMMVCSQYIFTHQGNCAKCTKMSSFIVPCIDKYVNRKSILKNGRLSVLYRDRNCSSFLCLKGPTTSLSACHTMVWAGVCQSKPLDQGKAGFPH